MFETSLARVLIHVSAATHHDIHLIRIELVEVLMRINFSFSKDSAASSKKVVGSKKNFICLRDQYKAIIYIHGAHHTSIKKL